MDDSKNPQTQLPTSEAPFVSPVEEEPTTEPPSASPQEVATLPENVPAPKPKKKGLLVGLIVAAVLVVLGGGGALAYTFWYQNPEKVVTDSLVNAINAKTMKFKATIDTKSDVTTTVTLTGGVNNGAANVDMELTSQSGGKDYTIQGSGVFDNKGDLYVKVKNADQLIDSIMGMDQTAPDMPAGAKKAISNFVTKINDQWIKVSSDDLKGFSEDAAKSQKCLQESFKKVQQDKAVSSELSNLYKKHQFIIVSKKLGSKDGNLGYELDNNKTEAKAFALGLKDTQLYKSLHDCDNSFTIDEKDLTMDSQDSSKSKVEIWVSRWTHQLTKLSSSTDDKNQPTTVTFEPTFNQSVTINTPDKSKSLSDLTKDFEDLQSALLQEYLKSAGSTGGVSIEGMDGSSFSSQL